MQDQPPFLDTADTEPDSQFGDSGFSANSIFLPDSGWGLLNHLHDVEQREIRRARVQLRLPPTLDAMLDDEGWLDEEDPFSPHRDDLH